jgi:hypothetical protein
MEFGAESWRQSDIQRKALETVDSQYLRQAYIIRSFLMMGGQ